MTEDIDFETYLCISKNKFEIFLFDKKNLKNLYKDELNIISEFNFVDFNNLSKFLDNNILEIEKVAGKFIKNIFLIIESDKNFCVDIGIKKKNYDNLIKKKLLENSLTELKDLFKENYHGQNIMHIVINNYLINNKSYSSFKKDLNSNHLCLEVNFTSISSDLVFEFDKTLEKYQIKISQYMNGNYIKNFFKEDDMELSEMIYKLRNGYNINEALLVPKNTENKGFFEKFFQLFS
jgi:hypothetical protein